jgi:hypothetical protein
MVIFTDTNFLSWIISINPITNEKAAKKHYPGDDYGSTKIARSFSF